MPVWLNQNSNDFVTAFDRLVAGKREPLVKVDGVVAPIIADVIRRGDDALIDYTRRFDTCDLTQATLRISEEEMDKAISLASPAAVEALKLAAARIDAFHRRHLPQDDHYIDGTGVSLGVRWTPVDAAGLYVPGGLAAYPSSVLMNAIPARIAGVKRVVAATPAPGGRLNPLVLVAARLSGVHEIYRIGGAQAIAAFAYGTQSIPAVDKIVGPGNAYVAEAKRQVFGHVGIDSIAGPSEVLIIAAKDNNPAWIAADLLAQAEHDSAAQCILITDDEAFARAVATEMDLQLNTLSRSSIAHASWANHGALIVLRDIGDAPLLANRLAAEHVQLCIADPAAMASQIRHAGAIFLGVHTPEAIGDYVGGPNHVLPTSGSARFASGLSVLDFMKRTTILGCPPGALAQLGPQAATLADAEGLDAHARSIRIRSNQ
ncbi:MAG: histidinol dehydrogenase [Alphaproteobacteria bacterium]|nr:histidinol dehydrogenase [Alphaproteobacteria bacterium]